MCLFLTRQLANLKKAFKVLQIQHKTLRAKHATLKKKHAALKRMAVVRASEAKRVRVPDISYSSLVLRSVGHTLCERVASFSVFLFLLFVALRLVALALVALPSRRRPRTSRRLLRLLLRTKSVPRMHAKSRKQLPRRRPRPPPRRPRLSRRRPRLPRSRPRLSRRRPRLPIPSSLLRPPATTR